ncbi:hypothetical protein MU582_10665 [Nocardioidaceae bacterium SCSIO 66511]|nr:hypothetical protein MU582_10665 [Nocardioidaceae bacterium SCSIO 66511]
MGHYEYYSADAGSVREIARRSNGSADSIAGVERTVDSDHRAAISEAAGEVQEAIRPTTTPFKGDASQMTRKAIWSACQLEKFADAIDEYNKTSCDPRSIDSLNAAYDKLTKDKKDSGGRALDVEKGRLDTQIDDAANEVATNLDREPTNEEIRLEWAEGNLAAAAVSAWPGANLKLTDLPTLGRDTAITKDGLAHFSDAELAKVLGNPDLNWSVRELIAGNRPEAVAEFAKDWKLEDNVHPGGTCLPGVGHSTGRIIGPDGLLYDLAIPGDAPPTDGPVMRPQYDAIPDDGPGSGWNTVMSQDGSLAFGDPVDASDTIAWILSGAKPYGEWQSVGADQYDYVVTDNGVAYLNDGTTAPPDVEKPVTGPIPDSQKPPPSVERKLGALSLAISGLEGLSAAQQAEYNRHYSSEVVFQENEDGSRRAIINTYQVQGNGEDLRIKMGYATVDPTTGELVPYTPPPE